MTSSFDKIKARRRAMNMSESLHEDVENSPRGLGNNETFEAALDDPMEMKQINGYEQSVEVLDEVQQSETLLSDLTNRRRDKQRELSKTLVTPSDDVTGQLRKARKKTKAKITQQVRQERDEAEDDGIDDVDAHAVGEEEEEVVEEVRIVNDDGTPRPSPRRPPRHPASEDSAEAKGSPTNKTQSMRDRLRNKVMKAREKAEIEADSDRPARRLRGLRDKPLAPTRFDDPSMMTKEDYEAESALEKSLQVRDKWKSASRKVKKTVKSHIPTESEAYAFFTHTWDPPPKEATLASEPQLEAEEPGPSTTQDAVEEVEGDRNQADLDQKAAEKQKLLDDLAADDLGRPVIVGRAEYVPYHEKLEKENQVYYVPSILTAPPEEKIPEDVVPRYLEEEGLYVGTRPSVTLRTQNKMEHRLLQEPNKGRDWFGEDGKIIALPDPLRDTPFRPSIPEDLNPGIQTEYKKAITKEFDSRFIDGSIEGGGRYQLDVDINNISLTHHHLFSREHVLSTKLTQLYNQHCIRQQQNMASYLGEKLQALKGATAHLQESLLNFKERKSQTGLVDLERRLEDYKYEIKQTRHLRDTELQSDRSCLKSIIKTWKQIKSLRTLQGYTNTPVKLQIRKEDTVKEDEQARWDHEIEEEVNEMREEYQEEYNKKQEEYIGKFEEWKQLSKAKKEASRRQKLRRKRSRRNEGQEDEEEELLKEEKDREIMDQEGLPKPVKPTKFDDVQIREQVTQRIQQTRRKPGEAILTPILTNTATITPSDACKRAEQQRRDDVQKAKAFVKVLFNNKEVSRTPIRNIGQDFRATFAQIFNIQIVQWPESIKVQVFESSGLTSTLLAEIYCGIPEGTTTTSNVKLEDTEFSSDHVVRHAHEGVGSGVNFSFEADGSNPLSMFTTGCLAVGVSWAVDDDGRPLVPPSNRSVNNILNAVKGMDAVAAIGVAGMVDLDKLSKWISESRLDPNDPSNADIVYMMRPLGSDGPQGPLRIPHYFRLEQLQEEFNFTTDEDIDKNPRYRLIQLREKEVPEFKSFRMIPPHEGGLPKDFFADYEKKKREEERVKSDQDIESHRAMVAKFMQQVREQVMQRFRLLQHQKTFSDVIFEDEVPNIGTLGISLLKLGEPRRPLRPIRKERKKVSGQSVQDKDVFILVNVVRAFDVPARVESTVSQPITPRGQTKGKIKNIAGNVLVRPYVELMFQHERQQTTVADGTNPSWNEELRLTFRPPNNDYAPSNLQTVKDVIYLNLFDQVVTDVLEDDRDRGKSVHQKIEKRWLGSLKIPFSTIYFNTMIEGTFKLEQPPILLGYKHDPKNSQIDDAMGGGGIEVSMGAPDQTYVTLFITMEPQLGAADPVKEKFDSNEDEKLLRAAEAWQADLEKTFQEREFKTTVIDINGKSVFITRYFKALIPPEELLEGEKTSKERAEKIARFVSMIPFVSDSVVFPGLCDIWSTSDQFMQMLAGDEEEHAVLLVNYFLHLGKKAWLILGTAIPEGATAYVLTLESGTDYVIWNANTGESFSYRDNYCPLQSVGCLVNQENIWANIQANSQPARISFNITNTSNWKPFFTSRFPKPELGSVQPEALLYCPSDQEYVMDLQDKIERVLKEKFMTEWRPRSVTRWNRYCTQKFRALLKELEFSQGKGLSDQHTAELDDILGSYKLSGFPINLPYTEIQTIIEAVYATGVWENDSNEAEFALAAHIHAYPNSVLSVWIYVASLIRKR